MQKIRKIVLTSTVGDDILRFVVEQHRDNTTARKKLEKISKKVVDKV